jgi:O-antigen/teichoic acid export membrane protein
MRHVAAVMPVVKGGGARIAALPISVALNLAAAKILLDEVGPSRYGVILLVANLATLVPFADFGISAPVITELAATRDQPRSERLGRVLQSSMRVLLLSASAFCLLAVAALALGVWPHVLGEAAAQFDIAGPATVAVCLIAFALPFGIGARVLIGIDRSHIAVGATLIAPAVSLAAIMLFAATSHGARWFAITVPIGLLTASVVNFALASRLSRLALWSHLAQCLSAARLAPVKLRRQAAPMFVLAVATPIALQTDRLVLSHRTAAVELTSYALAYQIYAPGLGVAVAGATALWPIAARRRAQMQSNGRLWGGSVAAFTSLGLLLAAAIVFLGPHVVRWLAGSQHVVPTSLFVIFGLLLVVQLASLPSVMLLTTDVGLKLQASLAVVSAVGNVALSWILAPAYGAVGPVAASLLFTVALQFIPLSFYAHRRALPREAAAIAAADP